MEIELRAKLKDGSKLIKALKQRRVFVFQGLKKEKDLYFKHKADHDRKLIIRIRRSGGRGLLTFKARSTGQDTAWQEVDLPLAHPQELATLLLSSGYEEVVVITKVRCTFGYKTFEVNIDRIKELGWFVEVEAKGGAKQRKILEMGIKLMLLDFGVKEKDIIYQGYVPLAIEAKKRQGRQK